MPMLRAMDDSPLADVAVRAASASSRPADTSVAPNPRNSAAHVAPMLTAAAVAILVMLSIAFARSVDMVAALWAASGVGAGVWLRSRPSQSFDVTFAFVLAIGIFVGEFMAGNPMHLSLMFTAANILEIACAVLLARRFAPGLNLSSVGTAARFLIVTAIVAPIPAALIVSTVLTIVRDAPFLASFQTWWFGHALGFAVILPLFVSFDRQVITSLTRPRIAAKWIGILGVLTTTLWYAHFVAKEPISFLAVPLIMLAIVRLRVPGAAAALLLTTGFTLIGVIYEHAATPATLSGYVLLSQLNLLIVTIPFILAASVLNERDALAERARAGQRRAEKASEAKSRLLANVAHEIKSPIGGVIGIGELWSSGQLGPVTTQQTEMANMLVKTSRQVESLAHDLLDVARAESGAVRVDLRPTEVCGVIEDVQRNAALLPGGREMRWEVLSEGPGAVAVADSQRLAQVLGNLASNAVKYAGSGGVVRFRVFPRGGLVRIEVADQGPGIPLDKQAQLFEPFNRLGLERSKVEGHGVGLAIARRLVELMGGEIGVTSQPGEGSIFWVELQAA